MIYKITQKEYRKEMRRRKLHGKNWEAPGLYFQDDLGNCYKTTSKGGQGAKEIADFKANKTEAAEQLTLL